MEKPLCLIKFCDITHMFNKYRSGRHKVVCKNGVLDSFAKFRRKHLCRSLLLEKYQPNGWLKRNSDTVVFLWLVKSFKNTYFEEFTQNNTIMICFVKINHLPWQGWEKITAGVFVSFCVAVPSNTPFVFTWPVLTNQISNLLRSNYKLSWHIRAEAPSKNLNSIHVDVHTEVTNSAVSWICEQIKEVVWARNPFHLTQV